MRSKRGIPLCSSLVCLLAVLALLLPAMVVFGDEPSSVESAMANARVAGGAKNGGGEAPPEFAAFADIAKEHSPVLGQGGTAGFFRLHYDAKKDQMLAVIPKNMMGKNWLLASSISGGHTLAGYMWGSQVVHWKEMGKKLVLIEPDLRYAKPKGGSQVVDAIERTYTDSIVLSVPIVAKDNGDPVIDLGTMFKRDYVGLSRFYGGGMSPSLSRWAEYKAFPNNVELEVEAAFMNGNRGTRARLHYSLVELPENDYKPRLADDRIGYFLTAVKDWTTPHTQDTIFKRYIHRWDVRKSEPGKAVSDADPDHKITFYIEKTVPVEYRRYVREGILEWNKAFEKAGIRNAISVEQQTDVVHADKDPEDVRYAFIRWIVSGRSFAMGPSLANPITGQILDADIIFDDSMVRFWQTQYPSYSATGFSYDDDPMLREFLEKNPQWQHVSSYKQLLPESTHHHGVDAMLAPQAMEHLCGNHGYCTYAQGLAHDMAFGAACLEATGNTELREEYVGQMVKEVVTHEVGHTLGLRHNFKASSWKSMEEILQNSDPDVPTSASIMDYIPGMIRPKDDKQTLFMTQAVGPYDDWAIEYGYRIPHADDGFDDEAAMLKALASRGAEEGLAYATDEDTSYFSPDPLVNRFDHGSDVIEYAKIRVKWVRVLLEDLADWAVKDGESYSKLRSKFDMVLHEYGTAADFAARYVGGQYLSRLHKGDKDAPAPVEIVPAAKQREALKFLTDSVLSEKDFKFDPELLNRLAAGRWNHWGSDSYSSEVSYPIHDRIAAIQARALFRILNPVTLDRVYDAELKVPADEEALTVPELFETLTLAVWSEVKDGPGGDKYTTRKPFISSIRRNLQRKHLEMMLTHVLAAPGGTTAADVNAVAALTLEDLATEIKGILSGSNAKNIDRFTQAHLEEVAARINQALTAKYNLRG